MRLYRAACISCAACLIGVSTSAVAQTEPTPSNKQTTFTLEGEVAPQWATPKAFDYGEVTDSTAVSLTFKAKPKISKAFELTISMGPKATLDDDHDNPGGADSAFGIGTTIKVPIGSFALVGTAGYDKKFKDFFGEPNGSKKTYAAGVEYGYPVKWIHKMQLTARAVYGRTDVTDDPADHNFGQAVGKLETPLWWFAKFNFEANGVRRWFDDVNPLVGFKERRTEWGVSVGLNFAPAIVKLTGGDPDNPWLRNLKAGFNYFSRSSNVPGADKTSSSPSLSVSVGHDF